LGGANVVADPLDAGNTVGEIISSAAGDPWQQADLIMQSNFMDLSTDITVQVDVYSTTSFTMMARVDDLANGTATTATAAVDYVAGGWQTMTFTFNESLDNQGVADGEYNIIGFFPNWAGGGTGNNTTNPDWNDGTDFTLYIDNITAVEGAAIEPPAAPTEAAPTPPNRDPNDVISLFSDAYTDIVIDTFDTSWCPATTSDVTIAGNATKLVSNLGCEGVEFVTSRFDASDFTYFHMDIWTDSETMDKSFNIKFSNWAGTGGEVNAIEFSTTNASTPALPSTNPGTWISLDMPLTSWTAGDRSDLVQFVITSDLGNVYYDNLYLHKNTLGADDFAATQFKVSPNPTAGNWNISSRDMINTVTLYNILGKQVGAYTPNANQADINATNLTSGMYFAKIESNSGTKTVKLIKQ
jgi:hypothetical protein